MRIIKNIKTMAACCVLCLTACQQDEFRSATSGHVPVRFAPERVTAGLTRVTDDDEWEVEDKIGIYMVPATSGDFTTYANEANIPYVIAQGGSDVELTIANDANPIYYPVSGENVSFVAYYPYNETAPEGGVYKVNVQDQNDPEAIDLLYAKTATDYNKQKNDPVALDFEHQLSRLILKVAPGNGIDMNLTEVTLKGFPTTADFSLKTGELSNINDVEDIDLEVAENGVEEAEFNVILIPQNDTESGTRTVDFTIDGKVYTYEFDNDFNFTAGNSNECTLTFTGTRLKLEPTTITLGYQNEATERIEFSSSAASLTPTVSSSYDAIQNGAEWLECGLSTSGNDDVTNWITYELTVKSTSAHITNDESSTRTAYIHLVGAAKTTVITVTQQSGLLTVEPNTTHVTVPAVGQDGNTFTITTNWPDRPTVSTSDNNQVIEANSLNISEQGTTDQDGNLTWTVTFTNNEWTVYGNKYHPARNANIVVKFGDIEKKISVIQSAYTTHVEDGLSNCYVLDSDGSVTFSVKRAYNGSTLRANKKTYNGGFTLATVWAENANVVDIAKSNVVGDGQNAVITIKAGTGPGNAVVALKDNDGTIVWSYHIWRAEVELSTRWLDRFLGATTNSVDAATSAGVTYQWGRKDPFPNEAYVYGNTETLWTNPETLPNATLVQTILNPIKFATGWSGSAGNDSWEYSGCKTVYDPCPDGYRVPAQDDWTADGWQPTNGDPYAPTNTDHTENDACGGYYPRPNMISRDDTRGELADNDMGGNMWARRAKGSDQGYAFGLQSLIPVGVNKSWGLPVRCIAETSPILPIIAPVSLPSALKP